MESRRLYGSEPTDLVLCDRAHEIYSDSDPLTITEVTGHLGGKRWILEGVIDKTCYSEYEVNEALLELEERYKVTASFWDGDKYVDHLFETLTYYESAEDYIKSNGLTKWEDENGEKFKGILVSVYDEISETEMDSYFYEVK